MNSFENGGKKLFKTEDTVIAKIKHFLLRLLSRIGTLQVVGFCMSGDKKIHQNWYI